MSKISSSPFDTEEYSISKAEDNCRFKKVLYDKPSGLAFKLGLICCIVFIAAAILLESFAKYYKEYCVYFIILGIAFALLMSLMLYCLMRKNIAVVCEVN